MIREFLFLNERLRTIRNEKKATLHVYLGIKIKRAHPLIGHKNSPGRAPAKDLYYELYRELPYAKLIGVFPCVVIAVVEFYQNLGFEPDPEGIKGMFWYPRY